MFTKEREDENFRIYVICEEKPGWLFVICYFPCCLLFVFGFSILTPPSHQTQIAILNALFHIL